MLKSADTTLKSAVSMEMSSPIAQKNASHCRKLLDQLRKNPFVESVNFDDHDGLESFLTDKVNEYP